ncbi:MAG: aminotransferase class V-fold PLP-dependent enzyme [Deltaproteobacteria bacterium]|nr:aminotransferase class V-fold PLP-dependent enzyme [Deltaproteobacteria bacterium]
MSTSSDPRTALFDRLRSDFLGLDRKDPVIGGGERRRVYLDTTATALMPRMVWEGLETYLEAACANSHTVAHRAGRDTTEAIEESRQAIGRLVGYDPEKDVVLFTGNGATGAINFLARALFPPELRPLVKRFPAGPPAEMVSAYREVLGPAGAAVVDDLLARPVVITTEMEHHSNLLPWIEAVGHHNVHAVAVKPEDGTLDLDDLDRLLAEHGPRVRLLAVTGVSNVTGIINPVPTLARKAHAVGAQVMIDGAQWVPHAPVRMHPGEPEASLDYLVLSGHKLYAPGSRGALIGSLQTLSGRHCVTDVGGGMVEYVAIEDFEIKEEITAREEAGTPNILGSISMGLIAGALERIGMDVVEEEEQRLCARLLARLEAIEGVRIYGSIDQEVAPRAGVVTFNVEGLHHAVVAAYLNDFHNIAVRNECFCAHPYVKCLLLIDPATEASYRDEMHAHDRRHVPGGVRASLGIYSTEADIEALGAALEALVAVREEMAGRYTVDLDGDCRLEDAEALPRTYALGAVLDAWERM